MESTKPFIPIPILLFIFPLLVTQSKAEDFESLCYNGTHYSHGRGVQFRKNLDSAFSILNNASSTAHFYNTTVGSAPNTAYASFLCRYDVPLPTCHDCITNSTANLQRRTDDYYFYSCSDYKEAAISYKLCSVHYANRSFFSHIDLTTSFGWCDYPALNDTELNRTVQATIPPLIDHVAAAAGRPNYFATGEGTYMVHQTLHGLVQCAPDINASDCRKCLSSAMYKALSSCQVSVGAVFNYGSCSLTYSLHSFYNNTNSSYSKNSSLAPQPLLSSQIPSTTSGNQGSSYPKLSPDTLFNSAVLIILLVMENWR